MMKFDLMQLREAICAVKTKSDAQQLFCLLAIAERLEALVDARKPRWVEFEWYSEKSSGGKFVIDANLVEGVSEVHSAGVFSHCEISMKSNGSQYVKGTLAEVMDKLKRGDK